MKQSELEMTSSTTTSSTTTTSGTAITGTGTTKTFFRVLWPRQLFLKMEIPMTPLFQKASDQQLTIILSENVVDSNPIGKTMVAKFVRNSDKICTELITLQTNLLNELCTMIKDNSKEDTTFYFVAGNENEVYVEEIFDKPSACCFKGIVLIELSEASPIFE